MRKIRLLMGLSVLLSGCSDGGHWMSSEYLIGRGWAKPPEQKPRPPLYCYRTLGEVNCYRSPQTGKGRRVDQGPEDMATAPSCPISSQKVTLPEESLGEPVSLRGDA